MWNRLGLCVVLSACGFRSASDNGADGGAIDAAIDGRGSGSDDGPTGATDCLGRWMNGPPTITSVDELSLAATSTDDRDPWISKDGLELHFARSPSTHGMTDVYRVTRGSTADPFDNVNVKDLDNLSTNKRDDRPALSQDEKTLVLSSDRPPGSTFQIYMVTRTRTDVDFASPNLNHLSKVNVPGVDQQDPFLSADGKALYLAPAPGGKPLIAFSVLDGNGDFMTPTTLVNSGSGDADPALTPDELILVFSSLRPGGSGQTDLWYATRSSKTAAFGDAVLIPGVNSTADDADPMLSADGCELYFSSNRGSDGKYHLFHARIMK